MYIRVSFKSDMLMRGVSAHVFLPYHDGYPDAKRPYPTLYFLPGYSANAEEISMLLPIRRYCTEHGIAVVIPDGENSFYTDHPERCALFSSYVGEELVRVTREMFPCLSREKEQTYIGGISMGGYGACTNGLRWHETFSKVMMLSPAIDPQDLMNERVPTLPSTLFGAWLGDREAYLTSWMNPKHAILVAREEGRKLPEMFMCCGRQDVLVYDMCKDFAAFADEHAIGLKYIEGDGQHDIPYWDGMLEAAFSFLSGRKSA